MTKSLSMNSELLKRYLKAGECLFREGDKGDYAYIIDQGEMEFSMIVEDQPTILTILSSGNMFGELALIDGRPRYASAYAKTDVILTIVTPEQVASRIEKADHILRLLLMVIMRYFRSETSRLRSEKDQYNLTENIEFEEKKKEAIDLIRLESDLRNALDKKEFYLVYQPIINLKTGEILGFEVLLRWYSPERGNVPPNLFIPIAESTSLMLVIGEWLIKESIQTILAIKKQTNQEIFISINLSQPQIESRDFFPFLTREIRKAKIKFEQIKLEILERNLFSGKTAHLWVQYCRSLGYSLIIDDFGTGYANLAYLKDFHFDTVKIDKSFIDKIGINAKELGICDALINLSHKLDMTVVGEGIETLSQAKILQDLNCDFGQGYLFSKPVSLEEAIHLIQSSKIKDQISDLKFIKKY